MFRNNCFRSVLQAINRYAYSPQTSHSLSLRSSSHRFLSRISDTNDRSFIDSSDVSPKVWTSNDKRKKRLSIFKKSVSELEFDVLGEELIKSTSIAKLFELISLHHSMMNNRHIAETFVSLMNLLRNSSTLERQLVLSSTEFQLLCTSAVNRVRYFTASELLTCFKALIYLGVSPQTQIVQSFLKIARQMVNDFTIEQILFFDFLLAKMTLNLSRDRDISSSYSNSNENTTNYGNEEIIPSLDALKLALPLILQTKIDSKELNLFDLSLVTKCLRIACERNMNDGIINKLVDALLIKSNELTIEQCYSTVQALKCLQHSYKPDINLQNIYKLIESSLDKVTSIPTNEFSSHLRSRDCNYILSLVSVEKNKRNFYHKVFFDYVANFLVENQHNFPVYRASHVLNALRSFDHIHYGLIDYISEQICVNQEFINDKKVSFVNILHYFSLPANYHRNKPNSAAIYDAIIESRNINDCRTKGKHLLFKVLKNLCILEYYPQDFIKDCVYNYLEDAITKTTSLVSRRELLLYFVTLYQSLSLDNINESNKSMTDKLKPYIDEYISILFNENKKNSSTNSLNRFLSQGLGGQQFVANGVFSEFGHYIDHVIVMRKGGYPVAIGNNNNENICFIKDLTLPSDSKLIGIIGLTSDDFCRHPFVLKGQTDHRIKTLRKSGIIPIAINSESFESLAERERIPFLMREIKEVLQQSEPQTNFLN